MAITYNGTDITALTYNGSSGIVTFKGSQIWPVGATYEWVFLQYWQSEPDVYDYLYISDFTTEAEALYYANIQRPPTASYDGDIFCIQNYDYEYWTFQCQEV